MTANTGCLFRTSGRGRRVALLLAAALFAAGAAAQDEEGESAHERLQRDQERVTGRLQSLREKMGRLSERYDAEGRQRNARLLRDAGQRFDEGQLQTLAESIQRDLSRQNLSTVERQDELLAALEDVQALLRDRRDLDELGRREELARRGLAEMGLLAENQRRLLSETRAATDRPSELLEAAQETARALAGLLERTESAARAGSSAQAALDDSELAESLARSQRELARAAALSEEEAAARSGDGAGTGEDAGADARRQAEARALEQERLLGSLEALRERLATPLSESAGAEEAAGGPGSAQAAREAAQQAAAEAERAMSEALESLRANAAEAVDRLAEAADAAESLRDELAASERRLAAARNRARSEAATTSRQAQAAGENLQDQAERLEALQPDEGPDLLDRTRELLAQLAGLAESAADARPDAAARAAAASASLNELLARLGERAERTGTAADRPPPGPEEFAALADRQAELQQRLRELLSRLQELPDASHAAAAERAERAMAAAGEALRDRQSGAATTRQREAVEQLEQATRELSGQGERYERLRQEEVLVRLGDDLLALRGRQLEIIAETLAVEESRVEGRLGRSQRRTVARLAGEERDLAEQADRLRVALERDQALAFAHAIAAARDDLRAVAGSLAAEDTGPRVRLVQGDVVARLDDLLAALEAELARRREALQEPRDEESGESPSGGDTRAPLVPLVAELVLIQRLEQAALARLDRFMQLTPGAQKPGGMADLDRELLARWSLEHARVTELFVEKFADFLDIESESAEEGPR